MRYFITFHQEIGASEIGPTRLIDKENLTERELDYDYNRAYFCVSCGRIWCRWTLDQLDFVGTPWYAYHRTCPDHVNGLWSSDRPGSMLLSNKDIVVVPRSILEYELLNYWRNNEHSSGTDPESDGRGNASSDANASPAGSGATG